MINVPIKLCTGNEDAIKFDKRVVHVIVYMFVVSEDINCSGKRKLEIRCFFLYSFGCER
jgi:hypothetical protein